MPAWVQVVQLQSKGQKGQPNGYPSLGSGGTIPLSQLSFNYGAAVLDFGSSDNGGADVMQAQTTVTATWVSSNSSPVVAIATGQDHTDQDDMIVEELVAYVANVTIGASFDIILVAPNGASGKYQVNWFSIF